MRALYEGNQLAKALLDDLAGRVRNVNGNQTVVDDLVMETNCERQEAIALLRKFEDCRCGRFLTGRRGQPSRFEWFFPAIEIAREVVHGVSPTPSNPQVSDGEGQLLEHIIWCRPGLRLNLRLPADMTQAEAEKIAGVIRNLWLSPEVQS
jgi:hypothetical protein